MIYFSLFSLCPDFILKFNIVLNNSLAEELHV